MEYLLDNHEDNPNQHKNIQRLCTETVHPTFELILLH